MAAPTIYRSTDTSAPVLTGAVGALVALLDACLVNGYGSKTAAGWTKPYTSTNAAVFKQGTGSSGMYVQVDDNGGATGGARDAVHLGFETMSAYNTGTGQFPTTAQVASPFNAMAIRKSTTADATVRPWMLIADPATFYVFVLTGDSTTPYVGSGFGDIYSYVTGDAYKCATIGGVTSVAGAITASVFGQSFYGLTTGTAQVGHWLPRNFAGTGGSTNYNKFADTALIPISSTAANNFVGTLYFPNQSDAGLYIAPIRVIDGSTPGLSPGGNLNLRGRLRGVWGSVHPLANFADGDSFTGVGEYAGRTFMVVKPLVGTAVTSSMMIVETTAWDRSS